MKMTPAVPGRGWQTLCLGLLLISMMGMAWGQGQAINRQWKSIAEDNVHDPDGPAVGVLQEPAEALKLLPPDYAGNQVRWVEALEGNYIQPRNSVLKDTPDQPAQTDGNVMEMNILMRNTGDQLIVRFPHKPHTEWLDCGQCHEKIFKSKAGATPISMLAILEENIAASVMAPSPFP